MSIGALARKALGPAFPVAGRAYRRIFVDVRKVAAVVPVLPVGGLLLDVGGGDGDVLNHLLDRQPSLRVVALDLASSVGTWVRPELQHRVERRPATSVRDYIGAGGPAVDMVLLSDVFHHVPIEHREQLVRDVLESFRGKPPILVVKDIVPAGLRSWLAFWADRNISGDRGVSAISPAELNTLVTSVRQDLQMESTPLLEMDAPNYCVVFRGS